MSNQLSRHACEGGCKATVFDPYQYCRFCAINFLRLYGMPEYLISIVDIDWVQQNIDLLIEETDLTTIFQADTI